MGQVIVEVPQNVFRSYHVEDSAFGEQLLRDLDENSDSSKDDNSVAIPPRRNSLAEDGDAVLGIWSDREDVADEIARRVREANRLVT